MTHIDPHFLKRIQEAACLASNLGFSLQRGREEDNYAIPPAWAKLLTCLQAVPPNQLDTLPPVARAELRTLAQLVKRAEQVLKRREFVGEFHQLFPDFNTRGSNLWQALKEAVVSEPDPLSWADEEPSSQGEATRTSTTTGQAEETVAGHDQGDTGQTEGGEPSADCAAAQPRQEPPTCDFPPEHLDPSRCPGCKALVPKEYSTLPRVRCLSCERWELHTGLLVGPVAGPPGTPPVVLRRSSPFWQPLLPDRLPSGGDMGGEEERQQQVAAGGAPRDQVGTGQGETDVELRERENEILRALLLLKADGKRRAVSRRKAALKVDPAGKPSSYNKAVAALVGKRLVESQKGPGGGIWLTPAGVSAAKALVSPSNTE